MELTYHRKGDYLFPNLVLEEENVTIGKYGMLRRTFLKEHKKGWTFSRPMTATAVSTCRASIPLTRTA